MPHVTFIHGILNKPAPDVLLRSWQGALEHDLGIDLAAVGYTSSMIYWADVMYPEPEAEASAIAEGVGGGEGLEGLTQPDAVEPGPGLDEPQGADDEIFIARLAAKYEAVDAARVGVELVTPDDAPPEAGPVVVPGLERVPLPWFIKRRVMESYLRNVHHYLFNTQHSPRPGVTYKVRDEIRKRFVAGLKKDAQGRGKHIVVSHSMGTVIAYDCLKRVADCPAVDALMTIGSPLGLDEVQDKLQPGWSRDDGFPAKVKGAWVNVFDRMDPVAGADAWIANDYRKGGQPVLKDIHEPNWGRWRHDIAKYLRGPELREALSAMLGID